MTKSEPWYVQRKRELEAAAPVKRKKVKPFVKVPLWWITAAAKARDTLVLIELLYASWKARTSTFPLPNRRLAKLGASREVKRRVLRDLEQAGLISVERPTRKSPVVTLIPL
jgi:ribosomal protein S19E (S16A)